MRDSSQAVLAALLLIGCAGSTDAPSDDSTPVVLDGRTGEVVKPDPHAGHDHAGHDHAAHGKKSAELPAWVGGPGTLTVVYSNNVDGEIEPCG